MKNKEQNYAVSKRLWSKEEDQLLIKLVGEQAAPKWTTISQEFNEKIRISQAQTQISRSNKQCRERWQNHLNPSLKNHLPWEEDEHRALFKLFKEYSHQWCELASKLESLGFKRRGENNIKNYFYSAIKRQIKRMNEIIREKNKETKKRKSQVNQYSKKYGYNPRLSLERQILGHSKQICSNSHPENFQDNSPKSPHLPDAPQNTQTHKQLSVDEANQNLNEQVNLHIIKELDYQLISKILLIAEEKGSKKFMINSSQSKDCHEQAERLRNQLIELIIQREKPMQKESIIELVVNMLKMSRKCKRKAHKMGNDVEQNVDADHNAANQKKKIKILQQSVPQVIAKQQNYKICTFNQKAQLNKLFRVDDNKPSKGSFVADLMKNSQQYKQEDVFNPTHLSILSSFDSGRHLLDSRNMMDRSSDFMCNSNFSMINFFEAHNPVNNSFINSGDLNEIKSPPNHVFSDFINNIREVQPKEEQPPRPLDFPQPHSVLFPVYDFSFVQTEKKSLFSSQPIINTSHPPPNQFSAFKTIKPSNNEQTENGLLHRSWTFSNDMMEQCNRRNAVETKRQQWVFTLPPGNKSFHNFGQQ